MFLDPRDHPPSLSVVLAVGTALRLFGLGAESYWLDEVASLRYVGSRTLFEVLFELPLVDRHPPLYYALLDGWVELVGVGEGPVRLLSALFGVAALPVLYGLGARLYDRRVGVVAAGLLAVAGFHVQQSQNARMYSVLVFGAVLSMYWLVRLRSEGSRTATAGYLLATVVTCYAHVFGLFVVAAQNLAVLSGRLVGGDGWPVAPRRWLGAQVGLGVLAAPYLAVLSGQVFALAGGQGGVALGWIPEPSVRRLVFALGRYLHPLDPVVGLAALALVAVVAAVGRHRVGLDPDRTAFLGWWVTVPILAPFVLSYLVAPLFVARYTVAALPGLCLLVAKELRRLSAPELRTVALGVVVVAALATVPAYYGQPQNGEWEAASSLVEDGAGEDTLVVLSDTSANATFAFYYDGTAPVESVPESVSAAELNRTVGPREDVWLVISRVDARNEARLRTALARLGYRERTRREFEAVTVYRFTRDGAG